MKGGITIYQLFSSGKRTQMFKLLGVFIDEYLLGASISYLLV